QFRRLIDGQLNAFLRFPQPPLVFGPLLLMPERRYPSTHHQQQARHPDTAHQRPPPPHPPPPSRFPRLALGRPPAIRPLLPHVRPQVQRHLVTLRRPQRHGLQTDRLHWSRDVLLHLTRRQKLTPFHLVQYLLRTVPLHRGAPRQQGVQGGAQGIDVAGRAENV